MECFRAAATTSTGIPRSKLSTRSRDLISLRSIRAKTARLLLFLMGKQSHADSPFRYLMKKLSIGTRTTSGTESSPDPYTRPAFLSVKKVPRFFIVLRPFAETRTVTFLPSSGMKRVFVWRLTWRRRLPVGLNLVARTRLEYPPPTCDFFPVMSHVRAIRSCMLACGNAKCKTPVRIYNFAIYNFQSIFNVSKLKQEAIRPRGTD